MPTLLPNNKFYGYKSQAHLSLLTTVFVCGLVSRQAILLDPSIVKSDRNEEEHFRTALKVGHIQELTFYEWVKRHKMARKYYAITLEGIAYLREHGQDPWCYHIPTGVTRLIKELYSYDKARQRATVGDAYAFAREINATMSDFIFCGAPGDASQVVDYNADRFERALWGQQEGPMIHS